MIQDTPDGKTYSCTHTNNDSICGECLGDMPKEYNQAQLYILINALENLMIPPEKTEYEFIRNNLLERFRGMIKNL